MLKRLLIVFVGLIVVLVVVVDRVGAVVAAHVLADKVQTDEHLAERPGVSVGGFPLITQAIAGKYKDVTINVRHLVTNGVPITKLTAHLHGVHVPLGAAVKGDVHTVPVDRTNGTVFISYADANRYLAPKHLTVAPGSSGQVKVTGAVTVAGQRLSGTANAVASVSDNVVHLTVRSVSVGAGAAHGAISQRFSVSLPLAGLPFQISLANITADSKGLTGSGTVNQLVLGQH